MWHGVLQAVTYLDGSLSIWYQICFSWFLVDGNFTSWENVGNCSQSCGGGRQYQRRNCTNPAPAYGGNNCTGNTSRTISCNSHACSGIQTKEFLLLLCTEILQFASKLSTLCLVSFICFGLLCKSFVSVL